MANEFHMDEALKNVPEELREKVKTILSEKKKNPAPGELGMDDLEQVTGGQDDPMINMITSAISAAAEPFAKAIHTGQCMVCGAKLGEPMTREMVIALFEHLQAAHAEN